MRLHPSRVAAARVSHHELHDESGTTLLEARLVYGTYGQLNAVKDNVGPAAIALHEKLPPNITKC